MNQNRTEDNEINYYEILGVSQDSSPDEIKNRYKALVLKFHPDKEKSYLAREAMVSINNAYEVLSDPKKKLDYDNNLQDNFRETPVKEGSGTRQTGSHLTRHWIRKERILPLIVFIIVFSITYQAASQTELSHESARTISDQFMKNTKTYYGAISHDLLLALPLFIPLFGIVWGVLAGISAGAVDKAVIMLTPGLSVKVSGLVLLYTSSFGVMKLLAYSIGMSRSLTLANSIWKKRCGKELAPTIRDAIIVVSLISLAGLTEHTMLSAG